MAPGKALQESGTVHGTTRAETEAFRPRRHYASFSFDNGENWTPPTRTNFPDIGHGPPGIAQWPVLRH